MKIITNPKLANEKITVIQDSSSEENLIPQQNYIQEDHLMSPEPIQENHEVLEEQVTPIIE